MNKEDFILRLREIPETYDGWYFFDNDGSLITFCEERVAWLIDWLEEHYPDGNRVPYIFPDIEGFIRFEWISGRVIISAEVDLDERVAAVVVRDFDEKYSSTHYIKFTDGHSGIRLSELLDKLRDE